MRPPAGTGQFRGSATVELKYDPEFQRRWFFNGMGAQAIISKSGEISLKGVWAHRGVNRKGRSQ